MRWYEPRAARAAGSPAVAVWGGEEDHGGERPGLPSGERGASPAAPGTGGRVAGPALPGQPPEPPQACGAGRGGSGRRFVADGPPWESERGGLVPPRGASGSAAPAPQFCTVCGKKTPKPTRGARSPCVDRCRLPSHPLCKLAVPPYANSARLT